MPISLPEFPSSDLAYARPPSPEGEGIAPLKHNINNQQKEE